MIYLLYRMPWFIAHLIIGLLFAIGMRLIFGSNWLSNNSCKKIYIWWNRRLVKILGVRVYIYGKPPLSPMLCVANHISWLDIVIIGSTQAIHFVAKHEVRSWPIIGWLAQLAGTIFIQRQNSRSMKQTISTLSEKLNTGSSIMVFPEATTTSGKQVNKFRTGIFQAAVVTAKAVQPLAIQYQSHGKVDTSIVPYINDDTFIHNLLRVMKSSGISAHINFLTPISSLNQDRGSLGNISHTSISNMILENNRNAA